VRPIDVSVGGTMEERAFAEIEQEPPERPLPQRGQRTPWWTRRPLQAVGAVAVVGLGAGIWFATRPAASVHVHGSLTLGPGTSVSTGDGCEGTGGYNDITAGVAVTVGGANGQTLRIGALGPGVPRYGDFCDFTFDVAVPAGQSLYTVTISHRGTQTVTPDQLSAGIQLTLGS
jgi:hypothetical protein